MNKKLIIVSATLLLLPLLAFAQPGQVAQGTTIQGIVCTVGTTALTVLWYVAIVVVITMFVLAGFKFLTAQGNPGQVAEARQAVIWGVVGVVIIVLAWSILILVGGQLGLVVSTKC